MAIDYVKSQAVATRLISENGRAVTLEAPSAKTIPDPAKPWHFTSSTVTKHVTGVFVPPSGAGLGYNAEILDFVKQSELVLIVATGDDDLSIYKTVIDSGKRWGIINLEVLKPGNKNILAYFFLARAG